MRFVAARVAAQASTITTATPSPICPNVRRRLTETNRAAMKRTMVRMRRATSSRRTFLSAFLRLLKIVGPEDDDLPEIRRQGDAEPAAQLLELRGGITVRGRQGRRVEDLAQRGLGLRGPGLFCRSSGSVFSTTAFPWISRLPAGLPSSRLTAAWWVFVTAVRTTFWKVGLATSLFVSPVDERLKAGGERAGEGFGLRRQAIGRYLLGLDHLHDFLR